MAWSTSELARLSGTTVKTVRYYHFCELLAEPNRAPNGYKQYGADHLVRLLRIKRLSELGLSLRQIRSFISDDSSADDVTSQAETLRVLDRELEAGIARQQQMREDIASVLDHGSAVDLPSGFGLVTDELTEADRGLLLIYSHVLDATTMDSMRAMLTEMNHTEASKEFQVLPAEAGESVRADLARRYAPQVKAIQAKYGWTGRLGDIEHRKHRKRRQVEETIGLAMAKLYSEAQIDVLFRIEKIISNEP